MVDSGHTLGDILAQALKQREHKMRNVIVTLHPFGPRGGTRKISDIKALRACTQMHNVDSWSEGTGTIGLIEAKAIIEDMHFKGSVEIEMTAERYGNFMVNRHSQHDYDWQVKSSRFATERPKIWTI